MGIPVLSTNFTVLSTCDSTSGWSSVGTLDPLVKCQGVNSNSHVFRNLGINRCYYNVSPRSLVGSVIRLWFNYTNLDSLDYKANGGICLMVGDGTNYGYWNMEGRDTYAGGWKLLTISTDTPFDSGSCNLSAVKRIGFSVNLVSVNVSVINTWWDYLVLGSGLTIMGGTESNPLTLEDIYQADRALGYGCILKNGNNIYSFNTDVRFGGTQPTYFKDSGKVLIYEDRPLPATLFYMTVAGTSPVYWYLDHSFISSLSVRRMVFDASNVNVAGFSLEGSQIHGGDVLTFKSGQTIEDVIFYDTNQVRLQGASCNNSIFTKSIGTSGALLLSSPLSTLSNCSFLSNAKAIQSTSGGFVDFINVTLSGNTVDVNNTSSPPSNLDVNTVGGTSVGLTSQGPVTFVVYSSLTLTGLVTGSEVRIYKAGDWSIELFGVESKAPGVDPKYSYTTSQLVDIVILALNYKYMSILGYPLPSSDGVLVVSQIIDTVYQ